MAHEYLAAEQLKATLELSGSVFAEEDVKAVIKAASRGIDGVCRRRFWADSADQTRYYTPLSPDQILIDDLLTITSLATDQDGDGTYEKTWLAATGYVLEPANAAADGRPYTRIRRHPLANWGFPDYYPNSVKLTGKFGWAAVPDEIVTATSMLAARLFRRTREAPFGVIAIGLDIGAVTRVAATDPDVRTLTTDYIREKPQ